MNKNFFGKIENYNDHSRELHLTVKSAGEAGEIARSFFADGAEEAEVVEECGAKNEECGVIGRLTPIFYNDEAEAKTFYDKIRGIGDRDITALVGEYIKDRKISDKSCNKKLWQILHDANLYSATLSNWNHYVSEYIPISR